MRFSCNCRRLALAGVAAALGVSPAQAQSTQAADPELAQPALSEESSGDVVVIARKREERLVDVPIAVTAISGESLGKLQALDLSGVQGSVPNVNLVQGRGTSTNANIFIRGIGQPDALQTFDPAVGIYVDGVYISRIQGALFNLFDVERVEVLRGPQGTLYGKNTIGGAVNVVSRKPDLYTLHASGSATYGSYDQVLLNGYVSVPLVSDRVALSVAGVWDKRDGLVEDPDTGRRFNDRDTLGGRAILRAQATDDVELIVSGDYTRIDTDPTLGYATAPLIATSFTTGARVLQQPYPFGQYDYRARTSLAEGQGQKLDHWGVALTANVGLGDSGFSLTSISAYRDLRSDAFIDIDATEFELGDVFVGIDQHQWSQELQLKYGSDRLNGVFGLYYLHEKVASHQEAYADDLFELNPATQFTFTRLIDDEQRLDSYAAFGQLTYDLTDRFAVTAGLRYTKEDKRYDRTTTTISNLPALNGLNYTFPDSLPAAANASRDISFDAWTPSVTLSFKPTRDTLLYATASRGFKSGGFNGRINSTGDISVTQDGVTTYFPFFEPEKVWTYEVGAKGNFLDGRVNLALAAFRSDYNDFQARVGNGTNVGLGGAFPVLNAGALRIEGVEAELTVKPVRAWTIRSTFGYLDADYQEFDDPRRVPPAGFSCNPTGEDITCEPAFAPPITFSAATDYAIPLGGGALTLGADTRFVDKHFLSVDNRPGLTEDGYWLLNAFVQYDAPGGRWYLRGGVKNLTESIYKTDGQEFSSVGNIQTAYYGDPRTWSATAGFRF